MRRNNTAVHCAPNTQRIQLFYNSARSTSLKTFQVFDLSAEYLCVFVAAHLRRPFTPFNNRFFRWLKQMEPPTHLIFRFPGYVSHPEKHLILPLHLDRLAALWCSQSISCSWLEQHPRSVCRFLRVTETYIYRKDDIINSSLLNCLEPPPPPASLSLTHTHTHTHILVFL